MSNFEDAMKEMFVERRPFFREEHLHESWTNFNDKYGNRTDLRLYSDFTEYCMRYFPITSAVLGHINE